MWECLRHAGLQALLVWGLMRGPRPACAFDTAARAGCQGFQCARRTVEGFEGLMQLECGCAAAAGAGGSDSIMQGPAAALPLGLRRPSARELAQCDCDSEAVCVGGVLYATECVARYLGATGPMFPGPCSHSDPGPRASSGHVCFCPSLLDPVCVGGEQQLMNGCEAICLGLGDFRPGPCPRADSPVDDDELAACLRACPEPSEPVCSVTDETMTVRNACSLECYDVVLDDMASVPGACPFRTAPLWHCSDAALALPAWSSTAAEFVSSTSLNARLLALADDAKDADAPVAAPPPPQTPPQPAPPAPPAPPLSSGTIVGIVIGAVGGSIVTLTLVLLVVYGMRRMRQQKKAAAAAAAQKAAAAGGTAPGAYSVNGMPYRTSTPSKQTLLPSEGGSMMPPEALAPSVAMSSHSMTSNPGSPGVSQMRATKVGPLQEVHTRLYKKGPGGMTPPGSHELPGGLQGETDMLPEVLATITGFPKLSGALSGPIVPPVVPLLPQASIKARFSALHAALDEMGSRKKLLFGKYEVLGPVERRQGTQGLVQFVGKPRSRDQWAVKFFLQQTAFEHEARIYSHSELQKMLFSQSEVYDNADSSFSTPSGYIFPPSIVTERGEGLNEWLGKVRPSITTVVDAVADIADRLSQLHTAGFAHRDIKPANLVRLQAVHGWAMIDYGCAAETGKTAPLSFTLKYAAPEVVQVYDAGESTVVSDASVDLWAMGIICMEMLSRKPVFPATATEQDVIAILSGKRPFPWQDEATRKELVKPLGLLRDVVLRCLSPDPKKRPTAAELKQSLLDLFVA